jgi:NADPH2:quinone reductase
MSYQKVVITRHGDPEVLEVVTQEEPPEPGPGEVRLRTLATSACFTDLLVRKGLYPGIKEKLPYPPGYDVVGVVEAVGPGVDRPKVGERVAQLTVVGAYSELLSVDAATCVPVPESLDPAEAVSLVLSYLTAWQMLHRVARVTPHSRVLIHGASGAVGTALVQLGKLSDLEMYGTASTGHQEYVAELGAVPIDYRTEDFTERIAAEVPEGVDAVFDPIGGSHFRRSFRCLKRGGILVAYGFHRSATGGGGSIPLSFLGLMLRNLLPNGRSAVFYNIESVKKKHPDWFRQDLGELLSLLELGKIRPHVSERLPLTEARRAHEMLENRRPEGKIVLVGAEP